MTKKLTLVNQKLEVPPKVSEPVLKDVVQEGVDMSVWKMLDKVVRAQMVELVRAIPLPKDRSHVQNQTVTELTKLVNQTMLPDTWGTKRVTKLVHVIKMVVGAFNLVDCETAALISQLEDTHADMTQAVITNISRIFEAMEFELGKQEQDAADREDRLDLNSWKRDGAEFLEENSDLGQAKSKKAKLDIVTDTILIKDDLKSCIRWPNSFFINFQVLEP